MPPSKQTLSNRRSDVARLNAAIPADVPIVAVHTGTVFAVWPCGVDRDTTPPLIAGRYQVVRAYVDGFTRAYVEAFAAGYTEPR